MEVARFQIASGSKWTMRFGLILTGFLLLIPLVIAMFGLPHGAVEFTTSSEGLRISGDSYGRVISRLDLDIAKARNLNLNLEPSYRLTRRTSGIALPEYQSGWFETAEAGKALVFVTDWSRAVVVPTILGYSLIIAPEDPAMFLFDLKARTKDVRYDLLSTPDGTGVPPGLAMLWAWILGLPVIIGGFTLWLCSRTRHVMFELSDDVLRIKGDLYGRTLPRSSLRFDEARLIDIQAGPDRLRLLRINGVALPGFSSGWHRSLSIKDKYLHFCHRSHSRHIYSHNTGLYTLDKSRRA